MALDAFINFEGIQGEALDSRCPGWNEITGGNVVGGWDRIADKRHG